MSKIKNWFRKYILRKKVKIYIRWNERISKYGNKQYLHTYIPHYGVKCGGFIFSNEPIQYHLRGKIIYNNSRMEKWK